MELFGISQKQSTNDFSFDGLSLSQPANHYNSIQEVIRSPALNLSADKI
jgi:hypothetical protein